MDRMNLGEEVKRLSLERRPAPQRGGAPAPKTGVRLRCGGERSIPAGTLPGQRGAPGRAARDGDRLLISGDVILAPISPIPVDLLPYLSTLVRLRETWRAWF